MLRIADKTFDSHLFTGTGKFASSQLMVEAIRASGSQLVTLAMKRVDLRQHNDAILEPLIAAGVTLLPNTSGAKTAEEAIFAAHGDPNDRAKSPYNRYPAYLRVYKHQFL